MDAAATIRASLTATRTKIAVIDDDPTGTQGVAGVPVVNAWGDEDLDWALADASNLFFIITNSRSMSEARAVEINREIGERLARRAAVAGVGVRSISRSDSTLRGHFPAEVDALIEGLSAGERRIAGTVLCPAFLSAGRVTIGDVHYVRTGDRLVPVAETEFAKDHTFGFVNSNLVDWAVEHGVAREEISSIDLAGMRRAGAGYVAERLRGNPRLTVANVELNADLATLVLGIDEAERDGREFVYRTGPSFVAARAGQEPRPPLRPDEIGALPGHGLVVVGSHTALTTRQLAAARRDHELALVELRADRLDREEIDRCAADLQAALGHGDAALVTSRTVIQGASRAESLRIAGRVADALVRTVAALPDTQPLGWVVAKGGITSSDIAARAFEAGRARVLGQIFDGLVSVWRLDESSRRPRIPYVVFPGNVGDDEALTSTVARMKSA